MPYIFKQRIYIQSLKNGQNSYTIKLLNEQNILCIGFRFYKGDQQHPSPQSLLITGENGQKRRVNLSNDSIQYLHLAQPILSKNFVLTFKFPKGARSFSINRLTPVILPIND